jgi:hypothetical protein
LNKKVNTVIFVLAASIFNIILAILCFVVLMVPIYFAQKISTALAQILFVIIIPTSLFSAFIIYFNIVAALDRKFDLEKYIHPIFINKKNKKKK